MAAAASPSQGGCRTVVVSGVPAALPPGRMADKLTIHFQTRRRSDGGDVERVSYPTELDGVAFVTFEMAEDAARVLKKEEHVMKDDEFPQAYMLTVFPFTSDVFLYVSSATLDLSAFGDDPTALITNMKSAHRSIRFQPLPEINKVSIEGPFAAVKALREELIQKASNLKPSTQTIKSPTMPSKPKVPNEISPEEKRFHHMYSKKNELDQQRRAKPSTNCRTSGSNTHDREVVGAETTAKAASSPVDLAASVKPKIPHHSVPWTTSKPANSQLQETAPDSGIRGVESTTADGSDDIWVDLYTFRYIQKFDKDLLEKCLKNVDVSSACVEESDLMRIALTEKPTLQTSSKKDAAEDLKSLMNAWQSKLRVQDISFDKRNLQFRKILTRVCMEVNVLVSDVLYLLEESCVKVIGPSASSHLFCIHVEERMTSCGNSFAKR